MANPFYDEIYLNQVLLLLDIPELPEELKGEINQAKREFEERGEITYPTSARIEYYVHKYQDLLLTNS